jgi:hypothetical protein
VDIDNHIAHHESVYPHHNSARRTPLTTRRAV